MMTPFAIIGSQRSGTTFLRRSLDDHPDIACHGEIFRPARVENFHVPALRAFMPDKEARDADPIGYLDRLLSFYETGFVGFKLFAEFSNLARELLDGRHDCVVGAILHGAGAALPFRHAMSVPSL